MYFIQSQSTNRHKVLEQSAMNLPTCAKEDKTHGEHLLRYKTQQPLIDQLTAQRYYTSLQYKSGEMDKASYWASVHRKRQVPRKTSSKPCKWVVWSGDIQACGCNDGQGCKDVICGCLCRRRAVPVMDAFFPNPFLPLFFFILLFFFIFFLFKS
jgi:hypothetical protein